MQSFFANQSCDPFSPQSTPCQLGNYVSYAVNVSTTTDVQLAVLFAKAYNLRLVVRNTGHECVIIRLPPSPQSLTQPAHAATLGGRPALVRWPSGHTT